MDKDHAKFILQSYRPDGADASNPDFAEALLLAVEDRELGLWLAEERAQDAVFVEALEVVDIPAGLRAEILAVMEYEVSGAELNSEMDGLFVGAMADVSPPEGLRDQIILAMEVTAKEMQQQPVTEDICDNESNKVTKFPIRWYNLAAVAAVLLLGVTFFFSGFFSGGNSDQLKLAKIQMSSAKFLNTSYEVDVSDKTLVEVNTWLAAEGMPVADTVPKGLISSDVRGGRKLTLDNGVQASMIFFEKKDAGDFYLMVLEADSVEDAEKLLNISEVKLKSCRTCSVTHFNITAWKDETKAYLLLSKSESKVMVRLF